MRARLIEIYESARSSFWFLPGVMMLIGVLLFVVTLAVDRSGFMRSTSQTFFYSGGATNAINLLQTLTGAMVAIATVVFSTLMLVLTLATGQFGHRLIRSFMRDRANQAVLGIFLSTFVYCMLVFHMVGNDPNNQFVPGFSITVGFALAIFATATLVYFTHHMASLIAAPEVLETVAVELDAAIDNLYPETEDNEDHAPIAAPDESVSTVIRAREGGYVQAVDLKGLAHFANEYDCLIESSASYGEYVLPGGQIARVFGASLDDDARAEAAEFYIVGKKRLTERDLLFAVNQIAEIAARALSPAINDPFTALDCINRVGLSLARVAARPLPDEGHYCDGQLRVIMRLPGFAEMMDAAFVPIRNFGRSSVITSREMLRVIAKLAEVTGRSAEHQALRRHADVIRAAAANGLSEARDIERIDGFFEAAVAAIDTASARHENTA